MNRVRLSKFLALVLRHRPQAARVALDPAGWVSVAMLIDGARRAGVELDAATLTRVVREDPKGRFELDTDATRVRAVYGHSVPIEPGHTAAEPPAMLLHGTATRHLGSIRRRGLEPGRRRYVHLSETEDEARETGLRHGVPAVLSVEAARMHAEGWRFHPAGRGLWLVERVPPRYIRFPRRET